MKGNYILLAAVLYPMLGAFAAYLAEQGAQRPGAKHGARGGAGIRLGRGIRSFVTVTEFLLFLGIAAVYYRSGGNLRGTLGGFAWSGFCGLGISFTLDGFRVVHGLLASFLWMVTGFYAEKSMEGEAHQSRYHLFILLTLGAALGVFLSADLYTTFIFFEIMSFTSFVWVAQRETREALSASKTYLAIAVAGGLSMLMGLFLLYAGTGTLEIARIMEAAGRMGDRTALYAAGVCMLIGFGAKAGVFALHVWMPESYNEAPAPASALLSGMLSKTGIYGLIIVTANLFFRDRPWGILMTVCGLLTMSAGALLALLSVQLKRTLAFSSMSQIGFILVGIGMLGLSGSNGTLAARGTALHMVNHSLIKLVLFLIAGVILTGAGSLELNRIRGYGRKKPLLKVLFLIPALGISGIPLFNGYVSKTLLHESILEAMQEGVVSGDFLRLTEAVFIICGGFTLAYMAKLFAAVFVEKNADDALQERYERREPYLDRVTAALLSFTCLIMLVIGCLPGIVADGTADWCQSLFHVEALREKISYFSYANLRGGLTSVLIGMILYVGVVRICLTGEDKSYGNYWPKWWNTEKLIYRPLFLHILPAVGGLFSRAADSFADGTVVLLRKTVLKDEKLPFELEEGTVVTYEIGGALDYVSALLHRESASEKQPENSYRHRLAVKHDESIENRFIIARSLSFGLLLFCLGLCATLIYILLA